MNVAIEFTCRFCSQPGVVVVELTGDSQWDAAVRGAVRSGASHDDCWDKRTALLEERRRQSDEAENARKWETLCPVEFQKPIKYTGTTAKKKLFDRIYAWKGTHGLWVHGKPGLCKTRFVWATLKRYFCSHKIFAITHSSLRERITGLASSEQRELIRFVDKLAGVDLLFLDDAGKGHTTPTSEEVLFSLLDARYSKNKITLFTSNLTIEEMASRFSASVAPAIARRIQEMVEVVACDEF